MPNKNSRLNRFAFFGLDVASASWDRCGIRLTLPEDALQLSTLKGILPVHAPYCEHRCHRASSYRRLSHTTWRCFAGSDFAGAPLSVQVLSVGQRRQRRCNGGRNED
jgi:hypothetical protein